MVEDKPERLTHYQWTDYGWRICAVAFFGRKIVCHVQNYWLQIISLKKMVSFVIIWFSHLWKSIVFLLTAQCVASSGVSGAWFPSFFWPLCRFLPSVGPAWSLLVWTHCWLISGLASRVTTGCFSDSYFSDRCLELFHSKCRILHFLVNLLKLLRVYIFFFFFFLLYSYSLVCNLEVKHWVLILVITVNVLDWQCLAVHSEKWTYPKLGWHQNEFSVCFFMNQCMFLSTSSSQDYLKYAK